MGIEIVKMTDDDVKFAAALEKICFSAPWSENMINSERVNPAVSFFSAKKDGEFIGHAGMIIVLDEAHVYNIAVSPDARRHGVGKALVDAMKAECEKRGALTLMLEVRASNAAAISLYEKCGFEKAGERKNFYSSPREDGFMYNYYFKKESGQ